MSGNLKDRDESFDAFRGVAIIAVVAIHAIPWQLYRVETILSYRQLLNFAVPVFLFISGYWMSKKPIRTLEDYTEFLRKRFLRIFLPYLLWSLVFIGYDAVKVHGIDIVQVVHKLFTGGAECHLYFIIVIAQLYILTPLLQNLNHRPYGFVPVLILNILTLCAVYFSRLHSTTDDSYYTVHDPFFSWVVFYQFGLFVGTRDNEISIPQNMYRTVLLLVLASLAVSDWEALFILSKFDNWQLAICALKYSSFIYSSCVILGFLVLRRCLKSWPRFLVILGYYSFGIYLVHMIVLRGLARMLHNIHVLYSLQPLYEFIIVSMTLLICCGVIGIIRKILPKPVCAKVLGF